MNEKSSAKPPVKFLAKAPEIPRLDAAPTGIQSAAGALVWRVRSGVLEVLLVHRPRYNDWSWPKGKVDPGESIPAGAAREVEEETGKAVALGLVLPSVSYRLSNGQPKEVRYWSAQQVDASDRIVRARESVARASILEIDVAKWMPVDEAHRALTRTADRGPLEALVTAHVTGRLGATQVFLLRHGHAKSRASWINGGKKSCTEETRPLTEVGQEQARALMPLLGAWAPQSIISSPWERCLKTVEPYASGIRRKIETVEVLSEDGAAQNPKQAKALMAAAIRSRESVIVCTHRPVLPLMLEALRNVASDDVSAHFPDSDPFLRPGHFMVAHIAWNAKNNPTLVALEQHSP